MCPNTERAIRRLERYHVGIPGCLFKGALLWGLAVAAVAIGLWFLGFISRQVDALLKKQILKHKRRWSHPRSRLSRDLTRWDSIRVAHCAAK
jgi:hypothetical protein